MAALRISGLAGGVLLGIAAAVAAPPVPATDPATDPATNPPADPAAAPAPAPAAGAATTLPRLADDQPIELDARSSDFDYKSNTLVFHGIRISQGGLAVEADEATATGLDFKQSQWVFRGHVRITLPGGSLVSDEARVVFAANAIATATAIGTPAAFEQRREQGLARGRAGRIEYDFGAGTVTLAENAWLAYGDNEMSGESLVYSPREQRVRANPDEQGSQRVRIVIHPPQSAPKPNP